MTRDEYLNIKQTLDRYTQLTKEEETLESLLTQIDYGYNITLSCDSSYIFVADSKAGRMIRDAIEEELKYIEQSIDDLSVTKES